MTKKSPIFIRLVVRNLPVHGVEPVELSIIRSGASGARLVIFTLVMILRLQ